MAFPKGMSRDEQYFYGVWGSIKTRCKNKNYKKWKNYGGRGIKFDNRWNEYKNFKDDMYKTYKHGLTIDRIDPNGNYEKSNCRWVTMLTQQNNRTNNRKIEYKGMSLTLNEWSRKLNVKRSTLAQRFYSYGWDINRLFSMVKKEA